VLTYWDAKGAEAGVHVRWLDADGRIAGPSVAVAPSKGGNFFPSLTRTSDGSFYVAWTDDGDANSEDLFLRHLSATLEPQGDAVRATDIARTGGSKPRVRYPSLANWGDALHIAFRMERDPERLIQHLRLPIADAGKGVGPVPKNGKLLDRFIGEALLVNTDKAKADAPAIQCANAACVLVWHGESQTGAWAAYLDPAKTAPLWRKKFAKTGAHPAVGMTTAGQAQLVWFESGRVVTASIGRDGVGLASKMARVTGEQPMPSITPSAKPGEWYIAWLDYETGHLEPYAARVVCK
jgi:serine/threonine-protein kinase